MAKIHVGTSGWHYGDWVGPFYPAGTRARDYLSCYADRFAATEINRTFYRLPTPQTLDAWREGTPPDFVFACKANRFITHMKKLKDPAESTRRFFAAADVLGRKLGPVLFQLPPNWRVNTGRLREFLEALPPRHRYAFEFRDESWFTPEVRRLLERHEAAFCIYDLSGRQSPEEVTADFVYLRLHGPNGAYKGSYDGRTLAAWARRVRRWREAGRDVYWFFDNDEKGHAPNDALRAMEMLARG